MLVWLSLHISYTARVQSYKKKQAPPLWPPLRSSDKLSFPAGLSDQQCLNCYNGDLALKRRTRGKQQPCGSFPREAGPPWETCCSKPKKAAVSTTGIPLAERDIGSHSKESRPVPEACPECLDRVLKLYGPFWRACKVAGNIYRRSNLGLK